MTTTVRRRRIEVLVDKPLMSTVEKHAELAGIEHYTIFAAHSGRGHTGRWSDDQLTGALAKRMFLAVSNEETSDRFIEALTPFLDSHGLVLFVSNVEVVRGERY
ncbi:hypothetical protein KCG44_07075 [Pacificimonas sp. WHA3]|uniref:Transcriptional regulator n=1 Tax=Pacificimonas pallii TaxID=2827236 RepID=A0ABS6SE61_9SPHN|nr:hypothetical protein [Pacificimonas pallii]MBV7256545.1 hypothetical protein [Pacificimonas pallii]